MSCYGWERGQITLPSAEVAGLKAVLRDYVNALHAEVRAEAVRVHKDVFKSTRSESLYQQRFAEWQRAAWASPSPSNGMRVTSSESRRTLVRTLVAEVLNPACRGGAINQPTVADVDRVVARATNRTATFPVISGRGHREASVSFNGRVVTWDVPENNHSVDNARESEAAGLFFAALGRVKWTRGTGGAIWGNNEYNEGEHGYGRGPDYMGDTFGPLGEAATVAKYRAQGFDLKTAKSLAKPAPARARGIHSTFGGSRVFYA